MQATPPKPGRAPTAAPAAGAGVKPAKRQKVDGGSTTNGGQGGGGKGSDPGSGGKDDDKKQKAALMKKAQNLKNKYLNVTAIQATINRNIETDEKYDWANNPIQKHKFTHAQQELQGSLDKARFNVFFVTNDAANLKPKFGTDLTAHLNKFMLLEPTITLMEKEQIRFNKMHIANMES